MQKRFEAILEIMNSRENVVVIGHERKGNKLILLEKLFNAKGRSEKVENLMVGASVCAENSEVLNSF